MSEERIRELETKIQELEHRIRELKKENLYLREIVDLTMEQSGHNTERITVIEQEIQHVRNLIMELSR